MLTLLGAQTTEDETARRARELEQLLLQVGRGDREAFAQLYGLTRGAVYALALSLLRDAHEAQDVAQDAFVKVWENAPSYRPQGSPMARLGAEEGQIVLLHAVTGLKHREIAQLLELPLSTVLSKYHRGLKKLKALMKGESDR